LKAVREYLILRRFKLIRTTKTEPGKNLYEKIINGGSCSLFNVREKTTSSQFLPPIVYRL
jgi:hypothetical protein